MVDDFDWTTNIPVPVEIPHWSGRSDGTEPGKGNQTFIYIDEDGKEHYVKVGGTKYILFDGVGGVSFYDSSITDDEINQGNNDVDYDPFDGKYEVEITRPQYNEYIRNGRLKYQMYDNFHPVNESDFDWVDKVKPFNLSSCNWIIETTNGDEWAEVEQFMFDNGWRWGDADEGEQIHSDYEGRYHFFFPDNHAECENEMFDAGNEDYFYNQRGEVLENFQDSTFYKWSDIRSFHINESDDLDWVGAVDPIITDIQGLEFGIKPKNIDKYGSKIHGWDHLQVLEDDGKFVKFQLCCTGRNNEYRDTVYYARSSDIQQRSIGSLSESNDFDWTNDIVDIHVGMCIEFPWGTEGSSKNWVITKIYDCTTALCGIGVELTSVDTGGVVTYGRKKIVDSLNDDTMTLCKGVNESNDFDWVKETPIPPIHVGGKLQTPNGNILTITNIDYFRDGHKVRRDENGKRKLTGVIQMVHWRVFHDGQWGDNSDRYWDVEKRIEDGVWIPVI